MNKSILTKNKVDDNLIKETKSTYTSNIDNFCFFKGLPPETQQFFYNCGYIPKNHNDANKFVSSIAQLNEKKEYDIDYALKGVLPKEKFFKLHNLSYIYALYPKVWDKLAVEDRLACLNFAYKDLLDKNNLKKSYCLEWFMKNYNRDLYGSCNSVINRIFVNFNKVLTCNGLRLYSTIAHEINHAKQNRQKKYLNRLRDSQNLNTYEKLENVQDDFFYHFLNSPKSMNPALDINYKQKVNKYSNTEQWEDFVYTFYYCDFMEISSRNVQVKAVKQIAKQCYSYYNDDIKNDTELLTFCKNIKNLHYENNFSDEHIEELNKLQTLVNYNMSRCKHLYFIMSDINNNLPPKVKKKINFDYNMNFQLQRILCKTIIDTFENGKKIPESFDRSLFDYIDDLFVKNKETAQDTINYYINEYKKEQELERQIELEIDQQIK